MSGDSSASHDPATLAAWRWASEDRILRHARSLVAARGLDPALVERLESSTLSGEAALLTAVADLLQEISPRDR